MTSRRRLSVPLRGALPAGGGFYPLSFVVGAGLILGGFGAGLWRTFGQERRPPGLRQEPLAEASGWLLRHQPERAAREYRQAAVLNPGDLSLLVHAGLGLVNTGDEAEGVAILDRARTLAPGSAQPLLALGGVRSRQRRFAEARRLYDEALRVEPGNARVHAGRGELWLEQDRFEEARHEFARSLQLEPGSADVHNSLGIVLALTGRQAEAVEHFSTAVRLKPGAGFEANLERARGARADGPAALAP